MIQIASFVNNSLFAINQSYNSTASIYAECKKMLDDASNETNKLNADLLQMQEAITLLKDMCAQMVQIEESHNALCAQVSQAEILKEQIKSLSNTLLAQIKADLMSDKENYGRKLAQKKMSVCIFEEKTAFMQEKQ